MNERVNWALVEAGMWERRQAEQTSLCNCGSGYPAGPLHENSRHWTCPAWHDRPSPGSRAAKERELERTKEKKQ